MKPGLNVGDRAELTWTVGSEHTIHLGVNRLGFGVNGTEQRRSAVVFSTPNMILLMERAARKAIEPFLEIGEESVGAQVHIDHLAATPIGAQVTAFAQVTAINSRTVDFDVTAFDDREIIGRGTHRRAIVPLSKIADRIAAKTPTHHHGIIQPMQSPANPGALPEFTTLQVIIQNSPSQSSTALVRLNRATKKNAVSSLMTSELEQLISWLAGHPEIRVVILQGAGDSFCAGDDLAELETLSLDEARELSYRQARLYLSWEMLPQVFIAAVDGDAFGAGCVMACACDFRVASFQSQFSMPEILRGWPPGYGIAQLTRLIGKARAMEMCTLGSTISSQQAADWGLVTKVVARQQLNQSATELANKLLAMPAMALRETKRLVHQDEGTQIKATYVADTAAYIECLATPEAKEGIRSFLEKRPPR